jgi:HEAT repeat protein
LNAVNRKLLEMLQSASPDRRHAAALVLGELGTRDAKVLRVLGRMAESPDRITQELALKAMAAIRSPATIRYFIPLLEADEEVRKRAEEMLVGFGPPVVAPLRDAALRDSAAPVRRRRSIIGIIARAGGRRAVPTLLAFLSDSDPDVVRTAGVAIRHGLDLLKPGEKADLLRRIQGFLRRIPPGEPRLALMAVDLLAGFKQAPARKLLVQLSRKGQHPDVRRAAMLGLLPYLQGRRPDAALKRQLFAALAEQPFQPVASTALDLLYRMPLGKESQRECLALLKSPHFPVRKFALRKLAELDTPQGAQAILGALGSQDASLRDVALECLQKLASARKLLLDGFLRAKDPVAAGYLAAALEAHREQIRPDARRKIVKRGWDLWLRNDPLAEPTLGLGRSLDPKRFHQEALGRLPALKRARNYERLAAALRGLARGPLADDDLRFELAVAELKLSARDIGRGARAADPSLELFGQLLLSPRFPLLARLRRERKHLGPEDLFYLGFHFSEFPGGVERDFGGDVLRLVIERSARSRFGRAARNKLKLQGLA